MPSKSLSVVSSGSCATVPDPHSKYRPPPELRTRTPRTRSPIEGSPLSRISLELARQCNLSCTYCYSSATPSPRRGLTDEEVRQVIDEAVQAGACMISIVGGGETLLRKSILVPGESCIDYANAEGCYVCVYTNCTRIDERAARFLFERDVTVVGKLNSLRDDVQDALVGKKGASRRIRRGVDQLLRVGFADDIPQRLALETVICRANYDELPEMWRYCRDRNIIPEFEIPTMHGRAACNRESLYFSEEEATEKYRVLFEELLAIDRAAYGFDWIPTPPFPAGTCRLYYSNCYVNDRGGVQPCAGVDQEFGFLRVGERREHGQSLFAIASGEPFRRMRNVHDHLGGICGTCELRDRCYGCRAAAWHKSGDLFAGDPVCWRCQGSEHGPRQFAGLDNVSATPSERLSGCAALRGEGANHTTTAGCEGRCAGTSGREEDPLSA